MTDPQVHEAVVVPKPFNDLIKYDVTEQQIAELRERYAGIAFDTPANYETGRKAIATLRGLRVAIEKKRKELKADSLEFGRRVDAVAKRFTELIEDIEAPLVLSKEKVDEERARAKAEAEAAKRREIEEKIRAEREAEEARLRAVREAEERALAEERVRLAAERERLEAAARAERERLEQERRAEQERLAQERAKLEAERRAAAERERREREAIEAAARAARERLEREQRAEQERLAQEHAEQFNPIATYAILDKTGWYEPGRMGWFGCSNATPEALQAHARGFTEWLRETPADALLAVVDCHI